MAAVYASHAPNLMDASMDHGHRIEDGPGEVGERSYVDSDRSVEVSEDQWRDITKIVRDVGPTLSPDDELNDLAAAEAAVVLKVRERDAIIDQMQEDLRHLMRQYQLAKEAAERPTTHPSVEDHDAQVRELENRQNGLGKSLNEERVGMTKREGELQRARTEREEVENEDVEDREVVDGKALRLKLLSDAGFTLIPAKDDKTSAKILIRNDAKEDVHTVSIDQNKSRVHQANLLWSLASD